MPNYLQERGIKEALEFARAHSWGVHACEYDGGIQVAEDVEVMFSLNELYAYADEQAAALPRIEVEEISNNSIKLAYHTHRLNIAYDAEKKGLHNCSKRVY